MPSEQGGATAETTPFGDRRQSTGPERHADSSSHTDTLPSLGDRLVAIAPRERAGPRSANRLEYQRHWALIELLARHERGDDYCVLFEHHDDVLFLDQADAPSRIEFFQVKTSDRDWTVNALIAVALPESSPDSPEPSQTAPTRPRSLSIVGKLHDHWINYGEAVHRLTFVSNRPLGRSCRLAASVDRNRLCVSEFGSADWNKLVEAMRAEHGDREHEEGLRRLHVLRTEIPIGEGGAREQSLGRLATFLERVAPGRRFPTVALHRTVMSELERRNTFEGVHQTYPDLLATQGLSKAQFSEMLHRAGLTDDPAQGWADLRASLTQEGWPFLRLRDIHDAWLAYEVDRMDGTDARLQQQRRRVRAELASRVPGYGGTIDGLVAQIRTACATSEPRVPDIGQTDDYATAMILLELITHDHPSDGAVQTPHSRSAEEAA